MGYFRVKFTKESLLAYFLLNEDFAVLLLLFNVVAKIKKEAKLYILI